MDIRPRTAERKIKHVGIVLEITTAAHARSKSTNAATAKANIRHLATAVLPRSQL